MSENVEQEIAYLRIALEACEKAGSDTGAQAVERAIVRLASYQVLSEGYDQTIKRLFRPPPATDGSITTVSPL